MPKHHAVAEPEDVAPPPSKRPKHAATSTPPPPAVEQPFAYRPWPYPVDRIHAVARDALATQHEGLPLAGVHHPERGRCVVAAEDIPRGVFVCEYRGDLLSHHEACQRETIYQQQHTDVGCFMFFFRHRGTTVCVDATETNTSRSGIARYINHSRSSRRENLRPLKCVDRRTKQPHILLLSLRDIPKGEELFFDYGEVDPATRAALPFLDT